MKGDFSRLTFDPAKQFTRVLFQQGRPDVDADANEQTEILLDFMRTLAVDLMGGPFGTRQGEGGGFQVQHVITEGGELSDLEIGAGFYYVHGRRCTYRVADNSFLYSQQPHMRRHFPLPQPPFYVYLKVWDRTMTALQEPDLRELALGSAAPDTCLRTQLVWQVVAERVPNIPWQGVFESDLPGREIAQLWAQEALEHAEHGEHRPQMRARARPGTTSSRGGYLGSDNQLYRVEVHTGGRPGQATFTFSRDNGSVTLPIQTVDGDRVQLGTLGPGSMPLLAVGDWVELTNDTLDLHQERGPLRMIHDVDLDGRSVQLSHAPDNSFDADGGHPLLRRWDEQPRLDVEAPSDNAVPIVEGTDEDNWIELEDGVQVQFAPLDRDYRPGDYWLIPTRETIADVLWPTDRHQAPQWLRPRGVDTFYAPLAHVRGLDDHDIRDLRFSIAPQTFLP